MVHVSVTGYCATIHVHTCVHNVACVLLDAMLSVHRELLREDKSSKTRG